MKRIKLTLLALTLSLACSAMAHAGEFEDGWERGWEQGWKQIEGDLSMPPLAPLPPLPGIGRDTYEGGYNAGFLAGMAEAVQR